MQEITQKGSTEQGKKVCKNSCTKLGANVWIKFRKELIQEVAIK